jgi:hypothetical protein
MRRAFVLALLLCVVACDDDGIRFRVPMDASVPDGLDAGLDGGSMRPRPNGQDAQTHEPPPDGALPPPVRKNASMVSVPPAYTVAEESYKYTPKTNASGDTIVKVMGPAGMESDGVTVAWEPSKSQGGEHKVTVETKGADQTVSQEYTVTVAVSDKQASGGVTAKNGGQVTVTAPTSKAQGAGVSIGSGAVSADQNITIAQVDKSPPANNVQGSVKAVDFGEHGTVFAKPVTLALPLPDDVVLDVNRLGAYVYDPRGVWERVPVLSVDLQNKVMLARARHFSLYAAAQSALDVEGALGRMPEASACGPQVVGTAVLASPLSDVEASSVNNLTPELKGAVLADELSLEDLLRSSAFRGSLRAITVHELVGDDGMSIASRVRVRTLFVSDTGATVTHTTALGQVIAQKSFPDVTGSFAEISARLRGAAAVAHFGAHELERASLAARMHFLYDPEDLSLEAIDPADLGLSAVELAPGEAAELSALSAELDVDCDGLSPAYDELDDRLLPALKTLPEQLVSTIVGQPVLLRAELVNAPANTQVSWEVLDAAQGTLGAGSDGKERTFTAQKPGRYYVRVSAKVGTGNAESVFAIDALSMTENMAVPTCTPSAASSAVKVGQELALTATLGHSNLPDGVVNVEWGLVLPDRDPNALAESMELVPADLRAVLAPLSEGTDLVGCRAVAGPLSSAVGMVEVAALPATANLAPVDLTLSPMAASVQVSTPLVLTATAFDPDDKQGAGLSFAWASSGGSLGPAQKLGSTSSATFVAGAPGVYDVTVRVGDGASSPQTLTAHVLVLSGALGTVDADRDGWPKGEGPSADCDDGNAQVHPTALDVCGNALDEDCDGIARADDCDRDGYGEAQGDCNDTDPGVFPEAYELCDGIDNDCDQLTDESFGIANGCQLGVGACAVAGRLVCSRDGEYAVCAGTPALPQPEICDGLDNDCDGAADEDNVCPVCVPVNAVDDTCDGVDDDCDGTADDDFQATVTTCGVGACAATGELTCVNGKPVSTCVAGSGAASDVTCDGVDDDCDGQKDEDFVVTATTCGVGECRATGTLTCVQGKAADSCQALASAADDGTCDNRDNDCDGSIDEDYVGAASSCGVGECQATGVFTCVNGKEVDGCQPLTKAASDESCDGKDNDCDGSTDEDYVVSSTQCGQGECASTGQLTCVSGREVDSCKAASGAADDSSCNGKDDDCDGSTDEDYVVTVSHCGVGACATDGSLTCVNGKETDSCKPLQGSASDATCDNVDDDCNGQADEDFVPSSSSCGQGVCGNEGVVTCLNGRMVDSCVPLQGALDDANCNGADDDCDGLVDEDYVPPATQCGTGACQASGVLSCVQGVPVDTCKPLLAAEDDSTCNGIDDDCDGETDENYAATPTVCGTGACGNEGSRECISGEEVDTCEPLEAAASDDTCDGIDDDCDGETDEEYLASATECGAGACANTGLRTCNDGVEVDSCKPLQGAADDSVCDGVDNDCDDLVDEDFQPIGNSCGVGECATLGTIQCIQGVLTDTCVPNQAPAQLDDSCNLQDDDCDGEVDEEYQPTPTECGTGVCASTGVLECQNGALVDSCTLGEPFAEFDTTCNGVDDDCDEEIDEDYAGVSTACGAGACGAIGEMACIDGEEIDTCEPGKTINDFDLTCDNVDDDCDGRIDDEYKPSPCRADAQGLCANGISECTDGAEICRPGSPLPELCNEQDDNCDGQIDENGICNCEPAPEACDGRDNDCNGLIDDIKPQGCEGSFLGECAGPGIVTCVNEREECVPSKAPRPENAGAGSACQNQLDDDCDGLVDDKDPSCSCEPKPEICNGVDDNCDDRIDENDICSCKPAAEVCDAQDNDCNGLVDDIKPDACEGDFLGVCAGKGHFGCVDLREQCVPDNGPFPETLGAGPACDNGVDDDCDGLIDNEDPSCICEPEPELCNGIDDDCNGLIDDKCVEGNPGEVCQTATPLDPGPGEFNLDDYKDDNPSCGAPGDNDRWFILTVTQAPQQSVRFLPDFGAQPEAIAVFSGACDSLEQIACLPAGGAVNLSPGTYRVMFDSRPLSGGFGLTVNMPLP